MTHTPRELKAMPSAADKARIAAAERADASELRADKAERAMREVAADRNRWQRRARELENAMDQAGSTLNSLRGLSDIRLNGEAVHG